MCVRLLRHALRALREPGLETDCRADVSVATTLAASARVFGRSADPGAGDLYRNRGAVVAIVVRRADAV